MTNPNPDPAPDPKDTDPGRADPSVSDPNADSDDDDDDGDPAPTVESLQADLAKATKDANRRDRALRKAQAEIAALKNGPAPKDGDQKDPAAPDPEAKANRKLVAGAARVELATLGVAKEDHADILEVLNLDGIDVDDDGEVDADAVAERIEVLRKAFGGTAPVKPLRPRSPRITARDQGGTNGEPVNPDAVRWRRILGKQR